MKASYFFLAFSTADREKILTSNSDDIQFETIILDLSPSSLEGVVLMSDEQICSATNLQVLDISGENGVSAKQWSDFGELNQLKKLTLMDSKHHHSIIEQFLSRAVHLRYLLLRNVGLTTIPLNISNCHNIELVDLSHNQIEEITSLMFLSSLQKLILDFNKIKRIERANFHARALQYLSVRKNSVQRVTLDLIIIRHLRFIDLSHNGLTSFPQELLLLESIKVIDCSQNMISSIPIVTFLGKQPSLHLIDLSYNRLHIFPHNMITRTEILDLSHNEITKLKSKHFHKLSPFTFHRLYLNGNPIEDLSPEIYQNGLSTIIRHFKYNFDPPQPRQGITILLIGNPNSGKSTLIHAILQNHGIYGEYRPSVGLSLYDELELTFEEDSDNIINVNLVELAGYENYRAPLEEFYNGISLIWMFVNLKQYEIGGFDECIKPWIDILSYHTVEKNLLVVCTHKDLCKTNSHELISQIDGKVRNYLNTSFELMKSLKSAMIMFDRDIPAVDEFIRRISLSSTRPAIIFNDTVEASSVTMIGVHQLLKTTKEVIKQNYPNASKLIPQRWTSMIDFMNFEKTEELSEYYKQMSKFSLNIVPVEQIKNSLAPKMGIHSQCLQILQHLSETQKILWNKDRSTCKGNILTSPFIMADMVSMLFHHDIESFTQSLNPDTVLEIGLTPKELHKAINQHKHGILSPNLLQLLWIHHHGDITQFSMHEDHNACYMQKLVIIRDYFKVIYTKKSKEINQIFLPQLYPPINIMDDSRLKVLEGNLKLNVCFLFPNILPIGLMTKIIATVQQKISFNKMCERWKTGIFGYLVKSHHLLLVRQFSLLPELMKNPFLSSMARTYQGKKDAFDGIEFCICQTANISTKTVYNPQNKTNQSNNEISRWSSLSSMASDFTSQASLETTGLTSLWGMLSQILHEGYEIITDYQGCPAISLTACPHCLNYTFGSYWYCNLDLDCKSEFQCCQCSMKVDKDYVVPTVSHKNRDQFISQLMSRT